LSGREVVVVTKLTPVGVGRSGEAMTSMITVAAPLNRSFIPTARTGAIDPLHTVIRLFEEMAK
jgi:hypothetical protein